MTDDPIPDAAADAAARYQALVATYTDQPSITYQPVEPGARRTFGAGALKVHDRIAAMLVRGRLVVKLPRPRVDELIAAGIGERFDPGHGRIMKEWLMVGPPDERLWRDLTTEAVEYAGRSR